MLLLSLHSNEFFLKRYCIRLQSFAVACQQTVSGLGSTQPHIYQHGKYERAALGINSRPVTCAGLNLQQAFGWHTKISLSYRASL